LALNDVNVHLGMRVYAADGDEIGRVSDVYTNVGDSIESSGGGTAQVDVQDRAAGYGPSSPEGYSAAGPANEELSGEAASVNMPNYYNIEPGQRSVRTVASSMAMRVDMGGILGMGGRHLVIPFTAITEVVPDESVTIGYSASEAVDAFASGHGGGARPTS
jgi:hypothetical protein